MFLTGLYEDYVYDMESLKNKSREAKEIMVKNATENLSAHIRDERDKALRLIDE